ncbi:OmpA family protein [Sphingomonas asaccharolytica]|uniref:OmpA family protein n=1 Tax=Sphingomonas asaccharolytica TaxID=40681 RepID=UPI00082CBA22|nr:OmpA family protein [Sphingomonas asaccharolytica]
MSAISKNPRMLFMLALLTGTMSAGVHAQQTPQDAAPAPAPVAASAPANPDITVNGTAPADLSGMPEGPDVEGFISARNDQKMQLTTAGGAKTVVLISDGTKIKSKGGLLGIRSNKLAADQLLNGLPVSVKTVQWGGGLVASQIALKTKDLRTASMIRNGTDQRFGEQAAATEALRGRVADIDQYNVKGTTNVTFGVGKADLSPQAKADLCAAATQAEGMNNALLLVVGYTDSTGSQDLNQSLSEKRASRVVNYLQQACHWKPYRMLTPTGMSEADPAAPNDTPSGKAQNRRVAVNVMVSKAVDGM